MDALATGRAALGVAPLACQIGDHLGRLTPTAEVPGVGTLDLVADSNAACAQDAPVVIDTEASVGGVDAQVRALVRVAAVVHPNGVGELLQLAESRGDADGAEVVSFGEEKLDDLPPVGPESFGVGADHHALLDRRQAGGLELGSTFDLHHAEATGADETEALEETEPGDGDRHFVGEAQDGLVLGTGDELAVDGECLDAHARASSAGSAATAQTPAGHRLSTM